MVVRVSRVRDDTRGGIKFTSKIISDEASSEPEEDPQDVPVKAAFDLLEKSLGEARLTLSIAIDRLDEAFQGFPDIEIPALRALLRTYLDLLEFPRVKLKLFVRRDLFRSVVEGGFVNLTHINARKFEVLWDEEDLVNLLYRRVKKNVSFYEKIGQSASNGAIFDAIFTAQVYLGIRKSKTWV